MQHLGYSIIVAGRTCTMGTHNPSFCEKSREELRNNFLVSPLNFLNSRSLRTRKFRR